MGIPAAAANHRLYATIKDWCLRHPYWTLTLLTAAALLPFLAKPFNMDDPCYIWAGMNIQLHPANPYGFPVNWYGYAQPMWQVTQNPPLLSYYLALAALFFGWTELGVHFACWLPAIAVVLGTYRLAKNICRWPQLAALTVLFAPGFLVSATTVMCDVAMLSCWIWGAVYWTEGIRQDNFRKLAAGATFAALALLTKYNGACLIPLLAAYGLLEKRSVGYWALFLLIPVAAFFAFDWATAQLYGQALFSAAAQYSKSAQVAYATPKGLSSLNVLTFMGGCFAAALFCAPCLWSKKIHALFFAGAGALVLGVIASGMLTKNYDWLTGSARGGVITQVIFWSTGGLSVLALAAADVWRRRDPVACLLALWVFGIFAFAAFFNWTVNARAILPMAPAVGILIARRLEQTQSARPAGIKYAIVACAVLAILTAQADFQMASSVRKAAQEVCAKYGNTPGKIWFQGHWGLQYYMQSLGARPMDINTSELKPGDIIVIPSLNTNLLPMHKEQFGLLEVFTLSVFPGLATLSCDFGAGFYSTISGPLPFAFGRIPPEELLIYTYK